MISGLILLLAALAAQPLPMVFLFPEDIGDADDVRIEAQCPAEFRTLVPQDAAQPKLWYYPVAAMGKDGAVAVWYQRVNKGEKEYSDQRTLCMGLLDGAGWHLPNLHPGAPAWGGPDNVVLRRSPVPPTWGGFNVFQIVREKDRHRMLYWDQPEQGNAGALLAESNDGILWTKAPRGTVFTEFNDAFTLLPAGEGYLLYQTALEEWPEKPYPDNLDKKRRILTLRESKDLVEWTPQAPMLRPDQEDPPETEFYLMKAFPYGRGYAGLIMKYFADPAKPKQHSALLKTELIVSTDARQWRRPFRATDLGFWTYAEPFAYKGQCCFVVWHDNSLQLAAYPAHGLTAATAEGDGTFITGEFAYPAEGLQVHAAGKDGWVEAELLDTAKQPVAQCARHRVEHPDGTALLLPWKTAPGAACRVRFHLHDARVFALSAAAR